MKKPNRLLLLSVLLALIVLSTGLVSIALAQGETIVSIAAPEWMGDVFDEKLFAPFSEAHPGVKVVVVPAGQDAYFGNAAYDLDQHLEGLDKYTGLADVIFTSSYNLTAEGTRAGYFLDLTPLVQADTTLDTNDFFPAVWDSVQWDGGIWAMPVTASVQVLVYEQTAFDEAGLDYPDERWSLDDLLNAAEELTIRDENGNVTVPGLDIFSPSQVFISLLGHGFYDDNVIPNTPNFDDPELPVLMERWASYRKLFENLGNYDYDKMPMTISQPWRLSNPSTDSRKWAGSLLPGGHAVIDYQGFAVSRGTVNPEMAYELVKFLTGNSEVVFRFFGDTPARQSMVGAEPDDNTIFIPPRNAEAQALIDNALANGIPTSEMRFADYLPVAIDKMNADGVDAVTALSDIETQAVKNVEAADAKRETLNVVVATPVPTPSFGEGQIVLKFGLNMFTSSLPNRDQWDQLVKDFTAEFPAVGNIDLKTQVFQQQDMDELDCYYQPNNLVPDIDLSKILSLDPYLDADPDFDRSDVLPGVMQQLERDGKTWAYPITIQPSVLWYNTETFDKAGLVSPETGWTVDTFGEALTALKGSAENGEKPFAPQTFGNTYLLILMAAYGAVPYDYRTTPPTIDLTSSQSFNGIQQVLDLAKEGLVDYKELGNLGGGSFGGPGSNPVFSDNLSSGNWRLQNRDSADFTDPYHLTNYPIGTDYSPVAYSVGAGYIGANAQNPDACFAWLKKMADRPDLFQSVPARRSQIENPILQTAQGADLVALYQGFAERLDQPDVLIFPGEFGGSSSSVSQFIEQTWMNQAFDDYVLEDGDLEQALGDAQTLMDTYRECVVDIPSFDGSILTDQEAAITYYRQYTDCAIKLDPGLKETYAFFYQEENS
ncbi:MAG: extracellular solute-binding protein [Anaerolineae bacterium]